jgi:hypothetical protein
MAASRSASGTDWSALFETSWREPRRKLLRRRRGEHDAAHQLRVIDRRHARDPVAVGVADDHGGPAFSRSITVATSRARSCSVMSLSGPCWRACRAAAGAARESLPSQARRDLVVILRVAPARGQQHDQRPAPFGDQVDLDVVVCDESARALLRERRTGISMAPMQRQDGSHVAFLRAEA